MIQRIQTIYLLLVAVLTGLLLFMPLMRFANSSGEFALHAFSLQTAAGEAIQPTVYLGVILALACALPLVTIFLYRRRLLQLRLCVVEIVLLVGAAVMEGVYYYLSGRVFATQEFHSERFELIVALPVVCILFAWLAARGVFRDEMKVRAADRIR